MTIKPQAAASAIVLSGVIALAIAVPAKSIAASPDPAGSVDSAAYCTVGSVSVNDLDGLAGRKAFLYGAEAYRKKDYQHAIYMYKVAASYDDGAAEYDLGLIYFRGRVVPADKPLGAAWMVLAAEHKVPLYVKARDLMVSAWMTPSSHGRTSCTTG